MSALLKLLITGGILTGALRARLRAARRSAGVVAILSATALIACAIGAACLGVAAFFALRPSMADYQAALIVAAGFIVLSAAAALIAVAKVKRAIGTQPSAPAAVTAPVSDGAVQPKAGQYSEDPLVTMIRVSLQSPAVMSALALGIVAGRATKRSRPD